MANKSKIRMERSAMRDRIRTLHALERGRLSGRRISSRQPNPPSNRAGSQLPTPTTPPLQSVSIDNAPRNSNAQRIEMLAKIAELQAKLQLFLAVNTFTMQQGRATAEVMGTDFEGQHHIFRFVHTHLIDSVAKNLAMPVPKVKIKNWIAVMATAIASCPIVAAEDWVCATAVGIINLKSSLIALSAKLEMCTMH